MSQLDDEALASFNEVFASEAPDEGPPSEPENVEAPSEPEATAETPDEQPRDENGRFAPKNEPYAGKYNTVEDLEKAYLEAQKALGSYKSEVGELRQTLEQRLDALQQQQSQQPIDAGMIEQEPGLVANQIAMQAFQAGNDPESHPAWKSVMREWFDQDPYEATEFQRAVDRVRFERELEARTAPVAQTIAQQQNQMALQKFVADNPDLPDYLDQIQQLAGTNEFLANGLLSENAKDRVAALDALYRLAKTAAPARATPQQQSENAAAAAAEVEQAVQQAAVVSTANTNQGEAPTKDYVDEMFERWQSFGVDHLK